MLKSRWKRAILIVPFAAFLAGFVTVAWFSSVAPPHSKSQKTSRQDSKPEIDPNILIARYTGWLAAFTSGLVVVGVLQIVLLFKADKTARLGIKVAENQSKISGLQTAILERQRQIAHQEFIATHRPRLRVRKFSARLVDGLPVVVVYVIANVGVGNAHIKRVETTIVLFQADGEEFLPQVKPFEPRTLKGGDHLLCAATTDLQYDPVWGDRLEILGAIDYTDDNGIDRQTGFWHIRDPHTGDFRAKGHPEPNPDYEYED